jgi:hypothetical protein
VGNKLSLEERAGCGAAGAAFVVSAVTLAWQLRGFVDIRALLFVALFFGAVTGVAFGNVALGLVRLARGRRGLLGIMGWFAVAVASTAAGFFPVAPDHVLADLPFGLPMLESRQERLEAAVYDEDVDLTRRLARAGVGTREPRDGVGDPLFDGTRNPEIVRALLEGGLLPDTPDTDGFTRLMKPWSAEVAAVLLEFGASPNARGPEGRTPLMYAVGSDSDWTSLLIEAGADLRAVDDTGRAVIDYASPGSDVEALLQERAGYPPLRRRQDPEAPPFLGRSDWIVATEAVAETPLEQGPEPLAGSGITLRNRQLLRGDRLELTIEIRNHTAKDLGLRVEGDVSPAAYFVGGSHDVRVENPFDASSTRSFRWPPLALPKGAVGRLELELLARAEEAGDLDVSLEVSDPYHDISTRLGLLRTPDGDHPAVAPAASSGLGWALLLLLAATAALFLVVFFRGEPGRRTLLFSLAGLAGVCGVLLLFGLLAVYQNLRTLTTYQQTTCTVLDRREFLRTTPRASSTLRSRTTTSHEPRLALRYETPAGERVSEGFSSGPVGYGAIREFALGETYPCWYDPGNDRQVVVRRSLGLLLLGLCFFPLAIGAGALFVLWRGTLGR